MSKTPIVKKMIFSHVQYKIKSIYYIHNNERICTKNNK